MPRWILLCALLLLYAATAPAQLYLDLEGQVQGPIDGDVVFGPLTGTIATSSFSLSITTYIDPSSGLPTGPPNVSALTISKFTDSATVGMIHALHDGEVMTTCILDAYRPNGVGGNEHFLRLTLTGAKLESWSMSGSGGGISESASIAYDTLEWHDYITGDVYQYSMGTTTVGDDHFSEKAALSTFPNPTRGQTDFAFRLPASGRVSIDVFDSRGRHVVNVFDGDVGTTQAIATWNGRDASGHPVANGIYMVKMRAGEWLTTEKMAVLR